MAEDEEIRMRAKVAYLPIQYVMLENRLVEGEERERVLSDFLDTIEKAGITYKRVDHSREV